MEDKTILYLTDNSLDSTLMARCQRLLMDVSGGGTVVSVSQKPIDFGDNVCVGEIGRYIPSLDTQILTGLDRVDTEWVGIAEHDCVYPREHIEYIPSDEAYHYNSNLWYARCCDGSYSYHGPVLSQLVASKESLRRAMTLRLTILSDPKWSRHYPNRMGEPGLANRQKVRWLADRIRVNGSLRKAIEEYLSLTSVLFSTKVPCLRRALKT